MGMGQPQKLGHVSVTHGPFLIFISESVAGEPLLQFMSGSITDGSDDLPKYISTSTTDGSFLVFTSASAREDSLLVLPSYVTAPVMQRNK